MNIVKVQGREIFDSRGLPTIECQITLEDESIHIGSCPTGLSVGDFTAKQLHDGGKRLLGQGVLKNIEIIDKYISPLLIGKEPGLIEMDLMMIQADGTPDKSRFGANTILAASIAAAKAQAHLEQVDLYELFAYLSGAESVTLPFPLFNMINGGVHADDGLRIQEFLVLPVGVQGVRDAVESASELLYVLKGLLQQQGRQVAIGQEGGIASEFSNDIEALDFLMSAIDKLGGHERFRIGLDVAASEFYDKKSKMYDWNGKLFTNQELIELYGQMVEQYPIYSLEDGLSEHDREGWKILMEQLGSDLQIVGDDVFATNSDLIKEGISDQIANSVVIKPDQIGTITQTLQAIQICQEADWAPMVSHRSGETEDTFIVDLAVGSSAGQVKLGGPCRGERIAKYNRLLRIEDSLVLSLLED
jgi:enolase